MASVGEMVTGPWDGEQRLNAGWRYSSGSAHFAWDVGCPMGTPLYAIGDGVVVDCNDGVKDQPPGVAAGSGAPSNWIVLKFTYPRDSKYAGKTGYAYYQHLTKGGVLVKRGEKVREGDLIGKSGNSGNTTGPHLHLVVLNPGCAMNAATRYAYLSNPDMVCWEPRTAWRATKYGVRYTVYVSKLRPGVDDSDSVRTLRRALIKRGFLKVSAPLSEDKPGNKYTDAVGKAVAKWQTKHGYKADGTMGLDQARDFFKNNEHVRVVR
jgi:murein DD-endopeptidase MepM/ murein hydrolase activator NlpD